MNKTITLSTALVLLSGCGAVHQWGAETPPWTPGLVVDEITMLQVANPHVIDNPPPGVVTSQDGAKGIKIIKAYRNDVGNADSVQKEIRPGVARSRSQQ